jgi:hypothetical protein
VGRILQPQRGVVLLFCLLGAGCGNDRPKLTMVQGKIFYRNAPLQGGTIVFAPDAERGG